MKPVKVWFEKCSDCGNDTFHVIVSGYGECASDTQYFCSKCKTLEGGVFNDPLDEVDTSKIDFMDYQSLSDTMKSQRDEDVE